MGSKGGFRPNYKAEMHTRGRNIWAGSEASADDAVEKFAQSINVSADSLSFLHQMPEDLQARIIQEFDPSGTKDGNVLGRLQGFAASLARRNGLTLTMESASAHDAVGAFAESIGVPVESLSFMYDLPSELQGRIMQGFDPSGTKDGNVLGRLQGYVSSAARRSGIAIQFQAAPAQSAHTDEITEFAHHLGVSVGSLSFMYELPKDMQIKVIEGFDPSGTKDGNVLGRLHGYVASYARRARITLKSPGPWVQQHKEDAVSRFSTSIGVPLENLAFMYELPSDMQTRIIEGFDPTGTKDGNVLGRLQGYVASYVRRAGISLHFPSSVVPAVREDAVSRFGESLGIPVESLSFMYEFPSDVQSKIMQDFDPAGTKDGNVLGRLQGYAAGYAKKAGITLNIPTPLGPLSGQTSKTRTHVPEGWDVSLGKKDRAFVAALPPKLRDIVTEDFDPNSSRIGDVSHRLLIHAVTRFSDMLGLDQDTHDFLRDLPADVQTKVLCTFDADEGKGNVSVRLLDYATEQMEQSVLEQAADSRDSLADDLDPAFGWPEAEASPEHVDVDAFVQQVGLDAESARHFLKFPGNLQTAIMKEFDPAGTKDGNVWGRLLGFAQRVARQVGVNEETKAHLRSLQQAARAGHSPTASRGSERGYHSAPATEVRQFAARWRLDENAISFLESLPLQVRNAVLHSFDGSATKDGNVWGRLLPYCRMQWAKWLGVDRSVVEQLKSLPEEVQMSCLIQFDPSTSKDGDIAGRFQGFLRKLKLQARSSSQGYGHTSGRIGGQLSSHGRPSSDGRTGGYMGAREAHTDFVRSAYASPGGAEQSVDNPEVAEFIERIGVDASAAEFLAPLPEAVLREIINEFDPSGTKDGNVLGRLQGYVRHVVKKRAGGAQHHHIRSVRARAAYQYQ